MSNVKAEMGSFSQPHAANLPPDEFPDISRFVARNQAGGNSLHMIVQGMTCPNCAFQIERQLNKHQNVKARINYTTRRLAIEWQGPATLANDFVREASGLGFKLTPFDAAKLNDADALEKKFLLVCLAVAGFASGNIMLMSVPLWSSTPEVMGIGVRDLMHWVSALIAIPTVIFSGRPFFRSAWRALSSGRTNMDVPISVALILTTIMSLFETVIQGPYAYFDSVTMLLFLLLIGRFLDRQMRGKARAAAQDLLVFLSGFATVVEDNSHKMVRIVDIAPGMLLHVAAGEKICADGVILSGNSEVDTSLITGETLTQTVAQGAKVYGGMVNIIAPLLVRVTAPSSDSVVGEIIKLMERAEQGHARYVRIADRVSRYYTPVVHLLGFITFIAWLATGHIWENSLLAATTVLIITCPCALGLAVPAVQVLTCGRLFKAGVLLKSADAVEKMAEVDTVVFDKTGTLTSGRFQLLNPQDIGNINMQMAVSLAVHSRHPLAKSLVAMYGGKVIPLEAAEFAGMGIESEHEGQKLRLGRRNWVCGEMDLKTLAQEDKPELWLRRGNSEPVRFVFQDELRTDAMQTISDLRRAGYALYVYSGDRPEVVASVAEMLGIQNFAGQMSPLDKHKQLEQLKAEGRKVLMVGDGLNDAAAISAADVSFSPSSALDITQNAADMVFQGESLRVVPFALRLSKKAHRLVKENFVLTFIYNMLAVPFAMAGFVTPLFAALAMAGSSLVVVLNAQRLGRTK